MGKTVIEEEERQKMIHIVPIYLIELPFPHSYRCDECGAKHWYWSKRGIIKIGEKKVRVKSPFLSNFYTKELLNMATPSLIHRQLSKGDETTVRFKRYGDLIPTKDDVISKKKLKRDIKVVTENGIELKKGDILHVKGVRFVETKKVKKKKNTPKA